MHFGSNCAFVHALILQILRGEREADPSGYSCNHCYRRPIARAGETWWQNTLTG